MMFLQQRNVAMTTLLTGGMLDLTWTPVVVWDEPPRVPYTNPFFQRTSHKMGSQYTPQGFSHEISPLWLVDPLRSDIILLLYLTSKKKLSIKLHSLQTLDVFFNLLLLFDFVLPCQPSENSSEQCSKPLLVDDYGGLYSPIFWGL